MWLADALFTLMLGVRVQCTKGDRWHKRVRRFWNRQSGTVDRRATLKLRYLEPCRSDGESLASLSALDQQTSD